MNTARKSVYNIIFGLLGQAITIGIGILLPRLFLLSYGSETNGFLSSVNQIFAYLILLEMGVGAATVQALYGPIAKNEKSRISGIVSATNIFYKRTGQFYLVGVILLAIIYPLVVQSDISKILQIGIILIIGASGVVSYYFQAKYKLLLQAEGRQYVISNVTTIVQVATSVAKIILIACGFSVIWLQLVQLLLTLCQTIYYSAYIKKHYKWLNLKENPDNIAISQRNFVLTHEISWMIFNHTDVFLLTLLLQDLKIVSVYVLYNTFVEMVATMIQNVNSGFIYRLGQIFNSNKKAHESLFDCYETYYMAFCFSLYCITYMFLMPFMKLYTAGIEDANYLLKWMPLLFVAYKMLVSGRAACGSLISYAGHFKQTQWHAVVEATINLVLSVVGICFLQKSFGLGIYGTLVGTIAAIVFRANMMILYANRKILGRSPLKTYGKLALNIAVTLVICVVWEKLGYAFNGYISLICCAALTGVIVFLGYVGINSLCNLSAYSYIMNYIKRIRGDK